MHAGLSLSMRQGDAYTLGFPCTLQDVSLPNYLVQFRDPAQNLLYDGDGTRLCHWCSLKGFPPNAVIYTPYQSMDTCNQLLRDSFNCYSSVVLFRAIFGLPQLGQEQDGADECVLESSLECE